MRPSWSSRPEGPIPGPGSSRSGGFGGFGSGGSGISAGRLEVGAQWVPTLLVIYNRGNVHVEKMGFPPTADNCSHQ